MTCNEEVFAEKLTGYKAYPPNWPSIRKFIRERDKDTCQHCNAKNGELVTSRTGKVFKASVHVAHLDHDKENWNVSMDRLLLLCQKCHLKNDRENNTLLRKRFSKEKRAYGANNLKYELQRIEDERLVLKQEKEQFEKVVNDFEKQYKGALKNMMHYGYLLRELEGVSLRLLAQRDELRKEVLKYSEPPKFSREVTKEDIKLPELPEYSAHFHKLFTNIIRYEGIIPPKHRIENLYNRNHEKKIPWGTLGEEEET